MLRWKNAIRFVYIYTSISNKTTEASELLTGTIENGVCFCFSPKHEKLPFFGVQLLVSEDKKEGPTN